MTLLWPWDPSSFAAGCCGELHGLLWLAGHTHVITGVKLTLNTSLQATVGLCARSPRLLLEMQNTILCFSKVRIVRHFSVKNLSVKNVDWVTSKYWLSEIYFAKLFAWGSRGVNILTKFKQLFSHFSWNSILWLLLFRTTFAPQVLPIFLQSIMLLVALNCRKPFFLFELKIII